MSDLHPNLNETVINWGNRLALNAAEDKEAQEAQQKASELMRKLRSKPLADDNRQQTGYNETMDNTNHPTRREFDAELRSVRSDMAASQADLRSDFAQMQKSITEQVAGIAQSVSSLRGDIAEVKGEITGVKGEVTGVKGEITGVKGEIAGVKGEITGVKGEIAGVRGEISGVKTALTATQWTVGIAITVATLLISGVQLLLAYKGPDKGQQETAQPSVIYLSPPAVSAPTTPER